MILITFSVSAQNKIRVSKKLSSVNRNNYNPTAQKEYNNKLKLAIQYYRNKKYKKAASIYEELLKNKKHNNNFLYNYYLECLLQLRDFKKAEKIVKKQIKHNPGNLRYIIDLGYVYKREDKPYKEKKQFDITLKKIRPDKNQIKNLAYAFLSRRETEYAVKTYKKGRKILNNSQLFHSELADIYNMTGDYSGMINEYLELLNYNAGYLNAVQNKLQIILSKDPDNEKHEILRKVLLKSIQKYPDKNIYSEMLLWFSIQQKDFYLAFTEAKSLDRRYHENGNRMYNLAELCVSNKNYDIAINAYKYIIKKGRDNFFYIKSKVGLLNAKYLKIINSTNFTKKELYKLKDEYISTINELGKNSSTILLIRNLAHLQAFYLHKDKDAIHLLNEAIKIKNITDKMQAECKIELADILLFSGDVWEATLLYSQVEYDFQNEPIANLAKFKNAKLFYYIGEFKWAKAQLDVLKASTSKLIANDAMKLSLLISDNTDEDSSTKALRIYSRADLLSFQNKDSLALKTLDSIKMIAPGHPLSDEVIYKKAEIKIKEHLYIQADSLLQKLVNLYPYDILADDALIKRAELNEEQLHNKTKAMELYKDLLLNYQGSVFAVEARKHFRALRGDKINSLR